MPDRPLELPPRPPVPPALIGRIRQVVGDRGCLTEPQAIAPHMKDWRGLFVGRAPVVVKPASTAECAEVVRLCAEARVPMVPQGGNSSMAAGATPFEDGAEVVISTARMNRIRAIDPANMSLTAEAGCIVKAVQAVAEQAGCLFPLSFGGDGTAVVGGVLSTNAGGNNTLRYGNARDLVLGLEVVLPDGQVWDGLRSLRKDNTGYCLRHLFMGAEGTLGIITAAVLKLAPRPRDVQVAFCAVPDVAAALRLLTLLQGRDGPSISAFEYMARFGLALVLRHVPGTTDPLASPHEHYVLIELSSPRPDAHLKESLEAALAEAVEQGLVSDAVIAASDAQRAALWKLREEMSDAQKPEGGSIKNDISVPVSAVPAFMEEATAAVTTALPGIRPCPFGHVGDGNIHFNLTQPEGMARDAFMAEWDRMVDLVNAIVRRHGGSFSAEHGIGRLKAHTLAEWREGPEIALMRRIKAAIDPAGLMNQGKVLPPG